MDVEHLLNYPRENDTLIESPTNEEIIESVLNNDDYENDDDDNDVTPIVSLNEAFQALLTFNNYLLQHEQNIPKIVKALQQVKEGCLA
ncbi:hypothetical protein OROGR_023593 [Orobanche gracilis]